MEWIERIKEVKEFQGEMGIQSRWNSNLWEYVDVSPNARYKTQPTHLLH